MLSSASVFGHQRAAHCIHPLHVASSGPVACVVPVVGTHAVHVGRAAAARFSLGWAAAPARHKRVRAQHTAQLRLAFAHFDGDGDGAWSLSEMNAWQAALGEPSLPSAAAFEEIAAELGIELVACADTSDGASSSSSGGKAMTLTGVREMYAQTGGLAVDLAKVAAKGILSTAAEADAPLRSEAL